MIKIILDDKKSITVDKAENLTAAQLKEIFKNDPRDDVLRTYVLTPQPVSRREKPKA